jgi:hypothetical protein
MLGLITSQHVGQCLHHIRTSQQSDLDDLRLKVVDDGFHLLSYNLGWEVIEVLDAQCILYRDRGDSRNSLATKFMDKPDISLNSRDARAITTRDCQYWCTHFVLMKKIWCKGNEKNQTAQLLFLL